MIARFDGAGRLGTTACRSGRSRVAPVRPDRPNDRLDRRDDRARPLGRHVYRREDGATPGTTTAGAIGANTSGSPRRPSRLREDRRDRREIGGIAPLSQLRATNDELRRTKDEGIEEMD